MYHKSRYRARKKYYEKEENKEKKRIYMREYYQKNKEKRRNYIKNYHQKIKDVKFEEVFGQAEKEELREARNALSEVKQEMLENQHFRLGTSKKSKTVGGAWEH